MSRFGRHFASTRDIKEFERRLVRVVVDRPGALSPAHEALYRYAAVLARMNLLRTPSGRDVSVKQDVDELRRWMLEAVTPLVPRSDSADVASLRELAPVVSLRVDAARSALLARHTDDFGPAHLDHEIRNKKLVLVLGGGGGAGMFHLGTFSLFSELGITPELIVGSSMGSLLGTLRAISREYDPIATAMSLPRDLDYNMVFRPFSGYSRFGFPGAFHMNLLRISRRIFQDLVGNPNIAFSELPIKLHVVAAGIRTGFRLDDQQFSQANPDSSFSAISLRRRLATFFKIVRQISSNPRFLAQVVFGREPGTLDFPLVEAVGFSCAVPGLLHYDVYHDDPATIDPLEAIFKKHELLRLCDGGVVNNVPSNVAWDSVQDGTIGSRNAYIFAGDVFAPVSSGRNLVWVPVQQVARPNVLVSKPYADYHKTFRAPPSPLQVIVNKYSRIKRLVTDARAELAQDVPYIKRALEPLPPYGLWR